VIYEVRRGPLSKPTTFRLEEGVLEEDGPRKAHFVLKDLKRAQLIDGADRMAPGEQILALWFGRRRVAISSHSYARFGLRTDQSETFTPFVQAVLAQAAVAAPNAAFLLSDRPAAGIYGGVLAILAGGVILVLVATLVSGQPALGADLSSRLVFGLLLMLCPLPWLSGWRRRTFDPKAPPL
jgi:hypothetical protein